MTTGDRTAPSPASLGQAIQLHQAGRIAEAQQLFVDSFLHRSFHALVKEKPGRVPLSAIKLLKADAAAVLAQSEEIKARYSGIFGV